MTSKEILLLQANRKDKAWQGVMWDFQLRFWSTECKMIPTMTGNHHRISGSTLPPIIMEVKKGCISNRIVPFQIPPFSTSMIMGERVGVWHTHTNIHHRSAAPASLFEDPQYAVTVSLLTKS